MVGHGEVVETAPRLCVLYKELQRQPVLAENGQRRFDRHEFGERRTRVENLRLENTPLGAIDDRHAGAEGQGERRAGAQREIYAKRKKAVLRFASFALLQGLQLALKRFGHLAAALEPLL